MGGYDTTASSVSWFFHVLARHTALQARIAAEMEAVVGEDIGEIMSAKLPITDAFVRDRAYVSVGPVLPASLWKTLSS